MRSKGDRSDTLVENGSLVGSTWVTLKNLLCHTTNYTSLHVIPPQQVFVVIVDEANSVCVTVMCGHGETREVLRNEALKSERCERIV